MPQDALTPNGWLSSDICYIMLNLTGDQLRNAGKSLDEYVEGRFYSGIKTGLNKAFSRGQDYTKDKLHCRAPIVCQKCLKPLDYCAGAMMKLWLAGTNFDRAVPYQN